jgi:TolA-binding protein
MKMRYFGEVIVFCAAVSLLGGCEKKKTPEEIAAEEEAKWRKGQLEKAGKYYRQLAEKYPDSINAAEAKAKGEAISAELAPPPKK